MRTLVRDSMELKTLVFDHLLSEWLISSGMMMSVRPGVALAASRV